jgi:hypothetical protein
MKLRQSAGSAGEVGLETLAMVLLGTAAVAAWTGGWRLELAGVTISVRGVARLLVFAAVVLAIRAAIARRHPEPAGELLDASGRVIAGALLAAGVLAWTAHLSPYLGGADSYGYISASERIRDGTLIQHEPLADLLPYSNAILAATPLGYVPTLRELNSSVPAYPLGLPALMAVASSLGGRQAPFFVAPIMGLVLVAACCIAVHRWSRDATLALASGAAVAFHPLVFTYAIQPMSDVPAAACFVGALALLLSGKSGLLAGAAASAAFLIRPALLPGAAALAIIPMLTRPLRPKRLVAFSLVILAGVLVQAWSQSYLYGSPLASGYEPASEIFSLRFLPANARSYAYWGVAVHGVLWFAGVLVAAASIGTIRERLLVALPLLVSAAPYAFYRTYDHWETLRFILPLLVVATVASVAGVFAMLNRVFDRTGRWAALMVVLVWSGTWVGWLNREHVFDRFRSEERFARAGDLIARATPADAVVIASLHSGSLRYYARRQTLDWGRIPPGEFDATVGALEHAGHAVFVLLDGQEEQSAFETRHGDVLDRQGWLPSGQVRDVRVYQAPR